MLAGPGVVALLCASCTSSLADEPGAARGYVVAEYPGAHWIRAREGFFDYGRGGDSITHIVIHAMEGTYESAIYWFQDPSNPYMTSAHYLIRSSDGDITQMVQEADTAHHIGGWNSFTIGIEHEGWIEDPDRWYTDVMYRRSADLVRHLCDKYGVPIDRDHILGHVEVPGAIHADPGPGWNWDLYMRYVRESGAPMTPPPPAGERYAASLVAQHRPDRMVSGETAVAWIELRNDGTATWSLDETRLATTMPDDHASAWFVDDNWLSNSRPTGPDHSAYSQGTTGRFTFEIRAPEVEDETLVSETFGLVQDAVGRFGPQDMTLAIRVVPRAGTAPVGDPLPGTPAEAAAAGTGGALVGACGVTQTQTRARPRALGHIDAAAIGAFVALVVAWHRRRARGARSRHRAVRR